MTTRPFTGWHMAVLMVAFFGVVIAINFVMASAAVTSFGGTVVDNSYVASQRYNGWLAAGRAQAEAGWHAEATALDGRVVLVIRRYGTGAPLDRVTAVATHPLGRLPARALAFDWIAPGRYRARRDLPAGRWKLAIQAETPTAAALRFAAEVRT